MDWLSEYALVLSLLALSLAFMIYSAWTGARSSKTTSDYYVGGRSIGGIALGLSFFATHANTGAINGVVELAEGFNGFGNAIHCCNR